MLILRCNFTPTCKTQMKNYVFQNIMVASQTILGIKNIIKVFLSLVVIHDHDLCWKKNMTY